MNSPPPAERRRFPRSRVLLAGKICYGDQQTISIDCTVRGLSPIGATVRILATQALPAQFILMLVASGVAHEARVVWRRGEFLGLSLGEAKDLKGPVDDRLKAVRRLWVAVAPL